MLCDGSGAENAHVFCHYVCIGKAEPTRCRPSCSALRAQQLELPTLQNTDQRPHTNSTTATCHVTCEEKRMTKESQTLIFLCRSRFVIRHHGTIMNEEPSSPSKRANLGSELASMSIPDTDAGCDMYQSARHVRGP